MASITSSSLPAASLYGGGRRANAQASPPQHAARPLRHHRPLRRRRKLVTVAANSGGNVSKGTSLLEWASSAVPQGAFVAGARAAARAAWVTAVKELAPQDAKGAYARPSYAFAGEVGSAEFPAAQGRYVLYVGNACPWCHRVLLAAAVRGLAPSLTIVRLVDDPERATRGGWVLPPNCGPMAALAGGGGGIGGGGAPARDLYGVYERCSPGYRGRCTAPLLVDAPRRRAVCNESASLLRQLGSTARFPGALPVDLYPSHLAARIDELNGWIYPSINNGVYTCGFSTSQSAYDAAERALHDGLARCDAILSGSRFLAGDRLTEADLRLFPTVARFDAVYASLFRCGRKRIADYPHLYAWARDVHQIKVPGGGLQVSDLTTFDLDAARRSYFTNLFPLSPSGIVPAGPTMAELAFGAPHGRGSGAFEDVFWLRDE